MDKEIKKCTNCISEIAPTAKICLHCGSYQDWRKYIKVGNTTIALFIALITALGLLSDRLINLYYGVITLAKPPNISISINSIATNKISVLYSNLSRDKVITGGGVICSVPVAKKDSQYYKGRNKFIGTVDLMRFPKPQETKEIHMLSFVANDNANIIIDPNESKVLKYKINQRRPIENRSIDDKTKEIKGYCTVSFIDVTGKKIGNFIMLSEIDVLLLQEELQTTPIYNSPEAMKELKRTP